MKVAIAHTVFSDYSDTILELIESLYQNDNEVNIVAFSNSREAEGIFRRLQSMAIDCSGITSVVYNSSEDIEQVKLDYTISKKIDLYIDTDIETCNNLKTYGIKTACIV